MVPRGASRINNRCWIAPVLLLAFALVAACEGNPVFVEDEGPTPGEVGVLFIGNSITNFYGMSGMLDALADSAGHLLHVSDISRNGAYLLNHLEYATTEDRIASRDWDYIVLQDADYAIAFPESRDRVYNAFTVMSDLVRLENPDCGIIMYMDYALPNNTLEQGTYTFEEFAPMLRSGTIAVADSLGFIIAPVGWAFRTVRMERPDIGLYWTDGFHPSREAQYLQACVYYSVLFRESPAGNTYRGLVAEEIAAYLQQVAADVVLSEPETWNLP